MEDSVEDIKKAVFSVQMILLHGISKDVQLKAAGEILTQSEYADVVTERTISKLCGYPLCNHPLPETFPRKGNYRISLSEHKVYDIRETRLFCSADCLIASRTFVGTLTPERDVLADCRKVLDLAAAFEGLSIHESKESSSIDSPSRLKIHEQSQPRVANFDTLGSSNAIEGYVPQKIHGKMQAGKSIEGDHPNRRVQKDGKVETVQRKKSALKRSAKVATNSHAQIISEDSFTSCLLMKNDTLHKDTASPKVSEVSTSRLPRNKDRCPRVSWADQQEPQKMEADAISKVSAPERDVVEQSKPYQAAVDPSFKESVSARSTSSEESVILQKASLNFFPKKEDTHVEGANNDRLESAEAVAAALAEAAAIVASGETDCSEAVARAGITIQPSPCEEQGSGSPGFRAEGKGKTSQIEKTESDLSEEELDMEEGDKMEWWFSEPPEGFKAELSEFGTIWMALDGWISAASIAHIYGRDVSEEDNFIFVNGKEYARQIRDRGSISAEIERTIAGCFSRALPGVVEVLHLSTPISILEQALGRLLRTMSCKEAVPPFGIKQWRMIVALLLDALSVQRLPILRSQLANKRGLLCKLLEAAQTSEAAYETFKDLVLPMGRQPEFAARCGG